MSLYGVNAEFAQGMELVDDKEVESWRIGSRLVYALLVQAHYPNHEKGIPKFKELISNLNSYIEDEESIQNKDVVKMFDIICKENKPELLKFILNNPLIPNASYNQNIAKSTVKQAIRVGSIDILDFLIDENVQIISTNRDGIDNKNKYDEIKSLIFNIIQSVRIGHNSNKPNNLIIANNFWRYLAKSLYELYNDNDNENNNDNDDLLKYKDEDDNLELKRNAKFIISNPLIICSIYKVIHGSLSGKKYISKLTPIIRFICEHYMTMDDKQDLDILYQQCENDKIFDCKSLKPFNIKNIHALQQEYYKTKPKKNVKLFWTEYIMIKLINDYLGIEPSKINTSKRMDQYGNLNINRPKQEREEILQCITYIISNGAANHLDDILLPLLNDYKKQFIKTDDDNKEMDNLFAAAKYGKNIWTLKIMEKNDIAQLFENICNKQIELPLQLISFIISFVVL